LPGDISALWLFENGFQCFAVFAVHDKIISHIDTIYKSFHCDAQRCTSPAALMARLQTHHCIKYCKSHPVPPRRRVATSSPKGKHSRREQHPWSVAQHSRREKRKGEAVRVELWLGCTFYIPRLICNL
jgi:hypothetical protein